MKIRILGNRIRLRLTKSDVQQLKNTGEVSEKTFISSENFFQYTLKKVETESSISANFTDGIMTLRISPENAQVLTDSDTITIEATQANNQDEGLFLLIEKDLKCLDHAREDQGDMYENPNTHC